MVISGLDALRDARADTPVPVARGFATWGTDSGHDNTKLPEIEAFASENDSAMATMMAGMNIRPSTSVDMDFAKMMIAHHRGAIDMALAELRHGGDERLRRLAQAVVVEQGQEIDAMQRVVEGGSGPRTRAAPERSPR